MSFWNKAKTPKEDNLEEAFLKDPSWSHFEKLVESKEEEAYGDIGHQAITMLFNEIKKLKKQMKEITGKE